MSEQRKPPAATVPLQKDEHVTYHLVPTEVWESQMYGKSYLPERFSEDGFIHCTDTIEELVAVGNRYYREDPRTFVVIAIDCDLVAADIVYEDAGQIFPHIYGFLNADAVLSMQRVVRSADGTFLTMG